MIIKKVRLQNFRSHDDFLLEFNSGSTLITGKNGSGKTSIIESVFLLLQGTSFRSSDKEILQNGKRWFRVDLIDDVGNIRTVIFEDYKDSKRKKFIINNDEKYRLMPKNKFPVVIFEPDDLRILSGSPNRRRDFFDRLISQVDPFFSSILSRYNKSLKQRNNLLKQEKITENELFSWDLMLSEFGSVIIEKRIEIINRINQRISEVYANISGVNDKISIEYCGDVKNKTEYLRLMSANFQRDKILGHTDFGPHKHDIIFKFNHSDAKKIASRGEIRSLILALKFIETDILAKTLDLNPIILLDDVFSELDEKRQKLLTEHFSAYQTIITSTSGVEVKNSTEIKL